MFGKLSGSKTYIAAALAIAGAIAAYLTGDLPMQEAVSVAVSAILAATLRHGIAKAPAAPGNDG
jgi:VIT1/CCC1 family predicted Fe2+/Mn2+ transporter